MMKGFSTIKLIILLGLLVGVYMLVNVLTDKSRSKSFREELVEINPENVTKIRVNSKDGAVEVYKENEQWMVKVNEQKTVQAKESAVTSFLSTLETIKPGAITTRKKEKWGEYQVDSTGAQVQVFEGSEKTLDIIIGRFAMDGQRSYSTFVRLAEDDEVYNAKDFMGISLSRTSAGFRETKLFQVKKDSIDQIAFNYPDSSFVLGKQDGKWYIDGELADSVKVANYLSGIGYLSSTKFDDELNFEFPELAVDITVKGEIYKVEAKQTEKGWLIHSDRNTDGFFLDERLFEKIFKPRQAFFE